MSTTRRGSSNGLHHKKDNQGPEAIAHISDCYVHMWYISYCCCIVGHSLGALMYLKTKTLWNIHLSSFLQLLQKAQVSE